MAPPIDIRRDGGERGVELFVSRSRRRPPAIAPNEIRAHARLWPCPGRFGHESRPLLPLLRSVPVLQFNNEGIRKGNQNRNRPTRASNNRVCLPLCTNHRWLTGVLSPVQTTGVRFLRWVRKSWLLHSAFECEAFAVFSQALLSKKQRIRQSHHNISVDWRRP